MASFRVVTYEPGLLGGMCSVYNEETAREPHIAAMTPERFGELVSAKPWFDPTGLLVAVSGGQVLGWVHACLAPGSEPWQDPDAPVARIRMLLFPRDRLEVGEALVAEAVAWLSAAGWTEIEAMDAKAGYPFYRGLWMGGEPMCPATLPHVQAVLEVAQFTTRQTSLFMVAELAGASDVPLPGGLELVESPAHMAHEPMRQSWVGFRPMWMRAMQGTEEVGAVGWALLPQVAEKLGAPCVSIWALSVKEDHRRRGIATALVSRALRRATSLGARFASVGTQLWNRPAQATYARLGFRPYCILVGRTRNEGAANP